jgi:hypothetical protein
MMRSFNALNFQINKAFQKELDGVVHPTQDYEFRYTSFVLKLLKFVKYSSSDAHHQPHFLQAEDLETSTKTMISDFIKELKKSMNRKFYSKN